MKIKYSMIVALAIASSIHAAEDLEMITVESSTIADRFESKKTEVSNISEISGEEVDAEHAVNIQQVLQSIPGITTEVTTGDSLKIHLRGVENQMYMGEKPGVAVVIDGVPVFERTGRVNIDLDNIESIKVLKGGASYLFGDDALSGAVIITTKRGAKYNNNFASVEKGSFGFQKLLARTGYSNDDLSFHIQASERKADGYHEDSDYKSRYLNGKFEYYLDDTSDITFGAELSDRQKDSHGTVGGETEARTNPKSIYTGVQESRDYTRQYDVQLSKFFATYSKDFEDNSNFMLNGYIYTDDTKYISSPQTKDDNNTAQDYYDDNDYVYNNDYSQIQRGIKSEYRTSTESYATLLGLDLRANEYKNKSTYRAAQALVTYGPFGGVDQGYFQPGDFKSDDSTDENVYAIYGEYKRAVSENFSVTTNLRYDWIKLDYHDYKDNNFKEDFKVWSYRIGANYQLDKDSTIYTNFSTGFRAPTVEQLYAGDVSAWGSTINNPDLDPEQSFNYEIGYRTSRNGINYDISIFQLDRKDFIMKTSGNYGDTDTDDMWDNIGGARHRGLELAVNGNLRKDLYFNLAYTYLDATYTDYDNYGMTLGADTWNAPAPVYYYDVTGNTIPRTSKHQLNVITNYQATDDLKLTAEVNARSHYYADDLNALEIEGHATLNLGVDYKATINKYDLNMFVRVDNVFDKQYYNSARSSSDRNEDGVFDHEDLSITVNPGRVINAGLSMKF
ncbi:MULTISPECIES: TonB-dependent receptor [Sulfurovum]|uniref:TonB-dependent receptor n=1 Tax=Sulfurovum xiamenensis TaxID=3019066 RepID=A0ABT7QT64_9BACT|nr:MULTISPECIES: TonB-dependent receptor [Sulfurovum]EIF51941.1 TonB-dependent receptor [Sulfurovum sp. AR]MDM5264246.1 TonB-dependent receptor [Sulfurovum xiamenensis]